MRKKHSAQSKEYRIVNDAFIFVIIQFIKGDYGKRLFDEAKEHITVLRAYFIQFNPKKFPRYPSDKLVLLEISWQIESAYEKIKRQ